jgi:hypothetical protein
MTPTKTFAILVLTGASLSAWAGGSDEIGGLGGPLFGLATAPNGDLLVADASIGVIAIRHGKVTNTIVLPGITDMSPLGVGSLWALTGANPAGGGPTVDSGQGLHRVAFGTAKKVANLFAFEAAYNPDTPRPVDSNPFDVQSLGGHAALVADAGGNDLIRIDRNGNIDVLAVFPDEPVSTANIKALAGCAPTATDGFCGLPPMIPAQPVPTSIALGWDGYIYVGELKGFPGPTNESNIWRISPKASFAQCGASPDCVKVFDGGFTSIIDLAFGPDGKLYVAEMDESSWAAVEIFGAPTGGTVNACSLWSRRCQEVATDIIELTAITFAKDGALWGTQNSLDIGAAEVVRLRRGPHKFWWH